jgi:AcrR family transcriptional regulator
MRQGISDAAMRLFMERGFDQVTVDEIAAAADVGRKTVFNHFPRKEDLFFDRDDEVREILREAVRGRDTGVDPVEAYRLLAHRLVRERSPYVEFPSESLTFMEIIKGSETLKARARALQDELSQLVTETLAESAGRSPTDPDAYLAARLLLATFTTARIYAYQIFLQNRDAEQARVAFLSMIDKGSLSLKAVLDGTLDG